jgi:hypothetical protein
MITTGERAPQRRLQSSHYLSTIYAGVATALGPVHLVLIEELAPDAANADTDLPRSQPQRKLIATKFA